MLKTQGLFFRKKTGRWSYDGCPIERLVNEHSTTWRYSIPAWFVLTGTITALIKRGDTIVTEKSYGRPPTVKPAVQTGESA
jgi:hypothetical protein